MLDRTKAFLLTLLLALAFASPVTAAPPRSVTAGDVVAAVNALRSSQGLDPYNVDAGITAYAQAHSEYQAAIDSSTHTHRDGSSPRSAGLSENVAAGHPDFMTADVIVYQIWADPVHMKTMVGYSSGSMGVGVAANSTTVFVTLNVRPAGQKSAPAAQAGTGGNAPESGPQPSPIPPTPFVTSTPKESGAVVHEVSAGQSLWAIAIAYGVRINDLRRLNGMPEDSNTIYEGQKLLIRPPGLITPAVTPSYTANPAPASVVIQRKEQPRATLIPTDVPQPSPTADPSPMATETAAPVIANSIVNSSQILPLVVIVICSLAAAAILRSGFRRRPA